MRKDDESDLGHAESVLPMRKPILGSTVKPRSLWERWAGGRSERRKYQPNLDCLLSSRSPQPITEPCATRKQVNNQKRRSMQPGLCPHTSPNHSIFFFHHLLNHSQWASSLPSFIPEHSKEPAEDARLLARGTRGCCAPHREKEQRRCGRFVRKDDESDLGHAESVLPMRKPILGSTVKPRSLWERWAGGRSERRKYQPNLDCLLSSRSPQPITEPCATRKQVNNQKRRSMQPGLCPHTSPNHSIFFFHHLLNHSQWASSLPSFIPEHSKELS